MDTNSIRGTAQIQNFLQAKIKAGGIAAAVVKQATIDPDVDVIEWFNGLIEYGCV